MANKPLGKPSCHVCQGAPLDILEDYGDFYRVTSDCRMWPRGGTLGVCPACGCVQKPVDARLLEECRRIYADYALYRHMAGQEISVYDTLRGIVVPRSLAILKTVGPHLPDKGRLLDVGCGNGAMLRAFADTFPGWALDGVDTNTSFRDEILSIDNVKDFFPTLEHANRRYDVITLIHSLEHIVDPIALLRSLERLLTTDGLIVLQVPDYTSNPFDLLVADHVTHFERISLVRVLHAAEYDVMSIGNEASAKELTVVARRGGASRRRGGGRSPVKEVAWLRRCRSVFVDAMQPRPLGLFGVSIASVWVFQERRGEVDFFVDEDVHCAGRPFLGKPVHLPSECPGTASLLIAQPAEAANRIAERLRSFCREIVCVPDIS